MGRAALLVLLVSAAVAPLAPVGGAARAAPVWRVEADGRGVPAIDDGSVYFLTRRHEVIAVAAASGSVRWRAHTGQAGESTMGSRVLVGDGLVIAGDYEVVAFDAATGAPRWRFAPEEGYGAGIYLGERAGSLVFAGSPAGRIYAVAVRDGRQSWSARAVEAPNTTVFQPIADEDTVAAGYSTFRTPVVGGVVVVDRTTGAIRWRREFPAAAREIATGFAGGPVFVGGLVIAASGDGRIHALDRATGASRWSVPPVTRRDGKTQERDWRALARSGPLIVAGSLSGVVTAFEAATGEERWRYVHADGGSTAVEIVADANQVYVPHFGGLLVALNGADGQLRWETGGFSDGFNWAPVVSGGFVYAAGSGAGLCAFRR